MSACRLEVGWGYPGLLGLSGWWGPVPHWPEGGRQRHREAQIWPYCLKSKQTTEYKLDHKLVVWSCHNRNIKVTQAEAVWNVSSLTIRRQDMSLSAAAAAIVTSCLWDGEQSGKAGGQASWWYSMGYRHVCSCCVVRRWKMKRKSGKRTNVSYRKRAKEGNWSSKTASRQNRQTESVSSTLSQAVAR